MTFLFKKSVSLSDRKRLKAFISGLVQQHGQHLNVLNVTFCSDEEILEVNRQYLNHDYYTDIITFDLRERVTDSMAAELFISVDTVKSNSIINKSTVQRELHRVIFHGVLHLLGFNDKSVQEQTLMRQMEDAALKNYFDK
ncbi:rRNA maturation factor [Niabella soli DSM 19437]|uniref:Endoribonuclease YbeY n=1 Tax=Niabella soli DSM 19437 TaxID=929713 RepID=W0F4C7_9BACT|nr:rRNA maturation factor [Niabella soli DSM 19437]